MRSPATFLLFHYLLLTTVVFSQPTLKKSDQLTAIQQNSNQQVYFTENKGQVADQHDQPRPDVLFSGQTAGMVFHLRNDGISYQLNRIDSWKEEDKKLQNPAREAVKIPASTTIYRTDIKWIGANKNSSIEKGNVLSGYNNYFKAVCPDGVIGVQSFESIIYNNIYDSIDLKWYDKAGSLEYDYILAPHADYRQIQWSIEGAENIWVNASGELVVQTPLGEIKEQAPIAFQGRKKIAAKWTVQDNVIGFEIENYNPSLSLTIDPIVTVRQWGTYYGGGDKDYVSNSTIDASSNSYLTGYAESTTSIATTGSHQTSYGGGLFDAFIVKLNSNGVRQWGTYVGGADNDYGLSCILDASLNIYLSGYTSSTSAIATTGSHQPTYGGGTYDGYLIKFNSAGVRQWGTYYGGTGNDFVRSSVMDDLSNIYFTGETYSKSSIATTGSHQPTAGSSSSSDRDAFLVKFDDNGVRQWGTYYGGSINDHGEACTIDTANNVYLVGFTNSTSSIATTGSHQSTFGGGGDGFLVKFNSVGVRQWGTYYGGTLFDYIWDCVADDADHIYLAGYARSTTNITTTGSYQPTFGGVNDAFLIKFNTGGVRQWGTYYGGSMYEIAYGCTIDAMNNIYLTGETRSSNGISTSGAHQTTYGNNRDAFLVKFNENGDRMFGTYYGGTLRDAGTSCSIDASNNIYLAGFSESGAAISTAGSHQPAIGGSSDGFLVKFCQSDSIYLTVEVCDNLLSPSGKFTWTASGIYMDTLLNSRGCDSVITVDLTVNNTPTSNSISLTQCSSYVSPSGKYTWTTSGIYMDTILTIDGCDSILTIDLTINTIDTSVTQSGSKLTASETAALYQWLDCNNSFSPISGAVFQDFNPPFNSRYAVMIIKNGCTDTSACRLITNVGIEMHNNNQLVNFYPNPTDGMLYLEFGKVHPTARLELSNQLGQLVLSQVVKNESNSMLDLNHLANGIYTLMVQTNDGKSSYKIVKK